MAHPLLSSEESMQLPYSAALAGVKLRRALRPNIALKIW